MHRASGLLLLTTLACSSQPQAMEDSSGDGTGGTTAATTAPPTTSGPGDADTSDSSSAGDAGTTAATSEDPPDPTTGAATTDDSTTDDSTTGGDALPDPDKDGPWDIAAIDGSILVDAVDVPIHCVYPASGPPGPYPVVVVAHGFQLPPTQYNGYLERLASHGYVALTADFKAELFATDHVANTAQVLAGIDWAAAEPALAGLADTANVGLTGHSLGGKLALHGTILDPRVRASITLDPVDGSQMCDPQKCPDISAMLPADVPLGFVGETLDGSGGFMPCAPQADNFLSFFAAAAAPALAVTVNGANHMSFLDDAAGCGLVCSFCKMPTLDNAVVNALARAYVVAFYGRYLKGEAGYAAYLTGAVAQERYVEPGLVTLAEK